MKKIRKEIKELQIQVATLERLILGENEVVFEPEPYLLDPNKKVREGILVEFERQYDRATTGTAVMPPTTTGPVVAEGDQVGHCFGPGVEDGK